jgi:hypothetical protein
LHQSLLLPVYYYLHCRTFPAGEAADSFRGKGFIYHQTQCG